MLNDSLVLLGIMLFMIIITGEKDHSNGHIKDKSEDGQYIMHLLTQDNMHYMNVHMNLHIYSCIGLETKNYT